MVKIKEVKNIIQEAQYLKEKRLDYNLVKVYSGEWQGTRQEREELAKLRKQLEDEIFVEIIYILTHQIIRDVKQAKEIYFAILDHKDRLTKLLKRNVGIEVATLDYLKNIHSLLKKPEVIEKDKLLQLATKAITDEVTNTNGRANLYVNLEAEIERSKRYRRPLSLLFCDLDDFKKINDNYGHITGDTVLKNTAEIMRKTLRNTDSIYRYGGEEFACILPETDLRSACIAAERMRKVIAKTPIKIEQSDVNIRITMSIGMAQFGNNGITNMDEFVAAADRMMYKAKQEGKNRIRVYN